jgi:hypothetical protein
MFTNTIGVQVDANMWISNKQYVYETTGLTAVTGSRRTMQANHPVIISPALIMQTTGKIWKLYSRLGIALPCSSEINEHYEENTGTTTLGWSAKIKSSFSLGYTGALGLNYNVSQTIDMWIEASMLSLNLDIREMDYDNVNIAPPGATPQNAPLVVTYLKRGNQSYGGTVEQSYTLPFSNAGIYAGIAFRLGKSGQPAPAGGR